MSMRKKDSLWKLMAPSKTSGAMYLVVPTWERKEGQGGGEGIRGRKRGRKGDEREEKGEERG